MKRITLRLKSVLLGTALTIIFFMFKDFIFAQTHYTYEPEIEYPSYWPIIQFFSPPILNNPIFLAAKILIVLGGMMTVFVFEGMSRVVILLITLYCAGSLICDFIKMSLIGRGVIPY